MEGGEGDNVKKKGLCVAHLNVASILGNHKFDMVKQQIEKSHLNVFCASETWLTEGVPDKLVEIKGYELARLDRKWKQNATDKKAKKGGGAYLLCQGGHKYERE